jgi:hypothetical protein
VEEDTAGVGVEGADMAGEGVEEFGIDAMETEDGMASEGDQSLFDFQQVHTQNLIPFFVTLQKARLICRVC